MGDMYTHWNEREHPQCGGQCTEPHRCAHAVRPAVLNVDTTPYDGLL